MPYQKKNAGDPLKGGILARDWNYLLEAADAFNRQRDKSLPGPKAGYQPTFCLIRNDTGSDREQFDVVGIGAALVKPTDDLPTFLRQAAFSGQTPDTTKYTGAWAVLLEPLKAASGSLPGQIGLAISAGEAPVALVPVNSSDTWSAMQTAGNVFAEIVTSDYTLQAGASGSARILWTEDANEAGESWRWARVRIGSPPTPAPAFNGAQWQPTANISYSSGGFQGIPLYPGTSPGYQTQFDTDSYTGNNAGFLLINFPAAGYYLVSWTVSFNLAVSAFDAGLEFSLGSCDAPALTPQVFLRCPAASGSDQSGITLTTIIKARTGGSCAPFIFVGANTQEIAENVLSVQKIG